MIYKKCNEYLWFEYILYDEHLICSQSLRHPNAFRKARDLLVLELLFSGGMRVAELCGIQLFHYNPAEKTMEVIGKGSKNRILFITNKEVLSLLEGYLVLRSEKKRILLETKHPREKLHFSI